MTHLRTHLPTEVNFAGARLHTDATKRKRICDAGIFLVFKLAVRRSANWPGIDAPDQLSLLLSGRLQLAPPAPAEAAA